MRSPSLHLRLALTLLTLLLIAGSVNLGLILVMSQRYLDEVAQMSNRDLAKRIAEAEQNHLVSDDGQIVPSEVERLLKWMMVVHPGPHFYVLDLRGQILAYDPMAGELTQERVSLAPVRTYLDRERHRRDRNRISAPEKPERMILGDDPRAPETPAVFSVSLLPPEGDPVGYLYIVLRPQSMRSVADTLRSSYILQLGTRNAGVYLLVTLILGLLAFYGLTRPLRRLTSRVDRLRLNGDDSPETVDEGPASGDEVKWLEHRFDVMSERLHRYLDDTEKIDNLRRELLANVSHDLRTPIATLRGYLETLALGDSALTPEQRAEYLAIALRQSERLSRLVDELLELSKLDSHSVPPNLERCQIGELIQDNVQRFRLRAIKQGIHLEAKLNPDLPAVFADISLMERALENLIENALRHTDADGSVTVCLQASGSRLRVSVEDTGCGIHPEDLPFIFERFVGAPKSGNARHSPSSTGLGLAITRRVAELHGSELKVESEVGVGSTFSFELDIAIQTQTSNRVTAITGITRRTREWLKTLSIRARPGQTS